MPLTVFNAHLPQPCHAHPYGIAIINLQCLSPVQRFAVVPFGRVVSGQEGGMHPVPERVRFGDLKGRREEKCSYTFWKIIRQLKEKESMPVSAYP